MPKTKSAGLAASAATSILSALGPVVIARARAMGHAAAVAYLKSVLSSQKKSFTEAQVEAAVRALHAGARAMVKSKPPRAPKQTKMQPIPSRLLSHRSAPVPLGSSVPSLQRVGPHGGAPVAYRHDSEFLAPEISARTEKGVTQVHVRGREYVSELVKQGGYQVTSMRLQPGLQGAFPWLNRIASQYEQYRFTKLDVIVKGLTSATVSGDVGVYVDLDSQDPIPESFRDFLSNARAKTKALWEPEMVYSVPANPMNAANLRYVRIAGVPEGSDILWFDTGIAHIAYDNVDSSIADGTTIGRIYLDYEIELFVPHNDMLEISQARAYYGRTLTCSKTALFTGLATIGSGELHTALTFNDGGANGSEATIVFDLAGFYTIDVDVSGSGSPDLVFNGRTPGAGEPPTCEYEVVDAANFSTVGRVETLAIHVREPGQALYLEGSGTTVTGLRIFLAKDVSTMAQTHNVDAISDVPSTRSGGAGTDCETVICLK